MPDNRTYFQRLADAFEAFWDEYEDKNFGKEKRND